MAAASTMEARASHICVLPLPYRPYPTFRCLTRFPQPSPNEKGVSSAALSAGWQLRRPRKQSRVGRYTFIVTAKARPAGTGLSSGREAPQPTLYRLTLVPRWPRLLL